MLGRGRRRPVSQSQDYRPVLGSSGRRSASNFDGSGQLLRRSARLANQSTSRGEQDTSPTIQFLEPTSSAQQFRRSEPRMFGLQPDSFSQNQQNRGGVARVREQIGSDFSEAMTETMEEEENTNLDPLVNGINTDSDGPYAMSIMLQPPSRVRAGDLLSPPIFMNLRCRRAEYNPRDMVRDAESLWALACVVSEDGTTALAPPQSDLLQGSMVDSIHPEISNAEASSLGYASFSNLAIQRAGRYRIRISLIGMGPIEDSSDASLQMGTNLQSVVTRVINVDQTTAISRVGE
ncbi:hypothetical protein MMC12_000137 [Toensbergia leucococca]|nr:hypothetical protein [Toensbergia leucococca]